LSNLCGADIFAWIKFVHRINQTENTGMDNIVKKRASWQPSLNSALDVSHFVRQSESQKLF